MKYIDAEKLTKAIERKGLDCSFALKMERLDTLALIDSLQQEQPEGLDEAAEEYAHKEAYGGDENGEATLRIGFKAGAKWMAGLGYTKEETVYFERLCDENRIMVDLGWGEPERGGFNPGDKVIVQIRKAK